MNKKPRNNEEEDEGTEGLPGCYRRTDASTTHRFFIDENIGEPKNYRNLIQTLLEAPEGDVIEIWINSVGGRVGSALSVINAINSSRAAVVGVLNVEAHSAASMIFLSCHQHIVMPYSSMLVHEVSHGYVGKNSDLASYTKFQSSALVAYLTDIYVGFLGADEMTQVLKGYELWLDTDNILSRLEALHAYRQAQQQEQATVTVPAIATVEPTKPAPKRKPKAKK